MALATQSDPDHSCETETLAALRDDLGAAVYLSPYGDGEMY
ncbi:hypothetical protein ACWGQ4_02865 [Streptomyces sp. NPDC055721]